MTRHVFFRGFIIITAVILLMFTCPIMTRALIPQSERDALIALYTATNGDSWTANTNWRLPGDPSQFNTSGTENTWYGVTLTPDQQHVLEIRLPDNNLTGNLPVELPALTSLETLELNLNHLTGSLPDLAGMNALKTLDLSSNSICCVSASLATLPNLETIRFRYNYCSGTIPDLSAITSLKELDLSYNYYTGGVPAWLTSLPLLTSINFSSNALDGTVPDLSSLSQLQVLKLSFNSLSGSIPAWLNQIPGMKEIYLGSNNFSGSIPDLSYLTQLTALSLGGNGLTGDIPAYFSTFAYLEVLNLANNQHTGTIPDLNAMTGLTYLNLRGNQLTGTIPTAMSGLVFLETIDLGQNQLTGTIPGISNLTALTELRLDYNQLTGSIPSGIGNLSSLRILWLQFNQLEGGIPTGISQTDLKQFDANDNQLDGELIPELWNLSGLLFLNLSNNHLTGTIPPGIANASHLVNIRLNNNRLSGNIPTEISGLSQLELLYLDSNQLLGEIPDSLSYISSLNGIGLSYNGLYTDNYSLEQFIDNRHSGDFEATQTIPPTIYAAATSNTSIKVYWGYRYRTDPGQFRVYYSETPGSGYQLAGTVDKTESEFIVTDLTPDTTYYFVADTVTFAHANNQNTITSETSDEISTSTSGPGTLTITYPNGGESIQAQTFSSIQWSSTGGIQYVEVDYSTDNGVTWQNYGDALSNTGYVEWETPYVHSSQCLVRVRDRHSSEFDVSNGVFTIYIPKSITVTTPGYQTYWVVGNTEDIRWLSAGPVDNVKIEYSTDSGSTWTTVIASTPNTGTYNWTIPNTPSATCRVKISDVTDSSVYDICNYNFTIAGTPPLVVLTPNGTETWLTGSRHDITWARPGSTSPYVDIEYSLDGGGSWNRITIYTNNDGLYSWTVPNSPSTNCLIRVFDSPAYGSCSDTSDSAFTIAVPMVSTSERDALIALYNSTGGDNWTTRTNWRKPGDPTQFNDPGTENTWYGVTCNTDNTHVEKISLNSNNLVGTIPDLSALTELYSLKLAYNNLTGTIPPELNNMTALTEIDFTWNHLQIPLPDLSGLTALQTLKLGTNEFTGTIPTWLNTMTAIKTLELKSNQFSGVIPDLSGMTQLQVLNLDGNLLTGSLPLSLAQITTLTEIRISSNQVSGTIPDLSSLSSLKSLYLYSNQLTGEIPSWINLLTNLEYVNLYNNQLTGVLPDMTGLTKLKFLYLSTNQLSGSIPGWIGNLTTLTTLNLDTNRFSGSIPSELGNLGSLQQLGLESNGLTGSIPGSMANLTALSVGGLDIRYNGLYTDDSTLKSFLDGKQSGSNWESTQTVAPVDISLSDEAMDSVKVSWTPILYQSTAGRYRVYYSTTSGSGYTLAGSTVDKTEDNFIVTGLDAETNYYFVVETITDAHASNDNIVTSEYSAEVTGTTLETPTLTIVTPNNGENWEGNTTQAITWTSTGSIDNVKLEYSVDNGALWNTIAASVPNNGSFDWTVPNTPSTQCLVKISNIDGPGSDVSDAVFTIVSQRSLTLTTPNGTENWEGNTVQTISWTSTGSISDVKLEYSTDNGVSWNIIAASVPNNGSFAWTIPNTPSDQCYVKISDNAGSSSDMSNGTFTIATERSLTLTTPNGTENWEGNTVQTISWTSTGSISDVKLEYSTDNGVSWNIIAASVPNNGSFAWTISNTPSDQCYVKISDNAGSSSDMSNGTFTIATERSLTLTTPNGTENWEGNTVQTISWGSTGSISDVKLEYSTDNGVSWNTIAASVPNNGSFAWTIPNTPSTQCYVKISDTAGPANDMSNAVFTIAAERSLILTTPNGTENWEGNTVQPISWTSTGSISDVKLEYSSDNGVSWNTIAASVPNNGSFAWTIPNTPSTQCYVKISDTASPANDMSNAVFTIAAERSLTLTTPNGTENWEGNTLQSITWISTGGIANVKLEYSIDNGASWNTIAASVPNNGSFAWTVPNTPSTQCYVKISDTAGSSIDISNGVFTIATERSLALTTPNGTENWEGNTVQTISWTSTGSISDVKLEYSTDNGASWNTIAASVPNNGSFVWTVPNTPSTQCYVKIIDTTGSAFDVSNGSFTISAERSLTVISPNGGQLWYAGSTSPITWASTGSIPTVNIEYSTNNGSSWNMITTTGNSGSFDWTVPSTPSGTCLVKVSDSAGPASDVSDSVFTIDVYTTITLTSPNGGQNFDAGTLQVITWNYTGTLPEVNIDYSADNGSSWNSITVSAPNTGSYNWILPSIDSDMCLVRVSNSQATVSDTSDAVFGIWQAPSVTVTAPNGGETWTQHSQQTITWFTTGQINNVRIEYSYTGGRWWSTIAYSVSNTGSYQWTVPYIGRTSSKCLIRITALDNTGTDTSNGYFTILK